VCEFYDNPYMQTQVYCIAFVHRKCKWADRVITIRQLPKVEGP